MASFSSSLILCSRCGRLGNLIVIIGWRFRIDRLHEDCAEEGHSRRYQLRESFWHNCIVLSWSCYLIQRASGSQYQYHACWRNWVDPLSLLERVVRATFNNDARGGYVKWRRTGEWKSYLPHWLRQAGYTTACKSVK